MSEQETALIDRLRQLRADNIALRCTWELTDDEGPFTDIRNEFERLLPNVDRRDAEGIVAAVNALPTLLALADEALAGRAVIAAAREYLAPDNAPIPAPMRRSAYGKLLLAMRDYEASR